MIRRLFGRFRRPPSCGEIMEVLQSYLDGEVDAETARDVAVHLEACSHCSSESDTFERIKSTLANRRREIDPEVRSALEAFTRDLHTSSE